MNSIKKKITRYTSITISLLLLTILLITDISVDTWISNEFDRAMINKSNLLVTLVSEDAEEVEFDFADEFMPEFSGINDPEYYQLWLDNKIFERSKTLDLFEIKELPQLEVQINSSTITNITLPDGRSGRMYFTRFMPQIDSDIIEEYGISKEELSITQKPMELAYAISNESLNQILWFVDIIFISTSILAVIAVRMIVSNVVERGLKPLDKLNEDLKHINLNSDVNSLLTDKLPNELMPIANGINHFLNENKSLYSREKRIASDIAHELKTPIAELLNLSEVAIKFPHEKRISDNFTTEVLTISKRLKSIVNGILLLQKSRSKAALKKREINIDDLIHSIISRENTQAREIELFISRDTKTIVTSEIAIDTILTNLISNALYYSPSDSVISILIAPLEGHNQVKINISNISTHQYSESELEYFFEPLWQKDQSRTSSERYGLGLAIVKSYCDNINASLSVSVEGQGKIVFTIII